MQRQSREGIFYGVVFALFKQVYISSWTDIARREYVGPVAGREYIAAGKISRI